MNKLNLRPLSLCGILSILISPAFADGVELIDLDLKEARAAFDGFDFGVVLNGNEAFLKGNIPTECFNAFKFSVESDGFRIQDSAGAGKSCMDTARANNHICGSANPCVALSTQLNIKLDDLETRADKKSNGELPIGLVIVPDIRNLDPASTAQVQAKIDPFLVAGSNTPLIFISKAEKDRRTAQEREKALTARALVLTQTLDACKSDYDTLPIAETALLELEAIGQMSWQQADTERDEMDQIRFDALKDSIDELAKNEKTHFDDIKDALKDITRFEDRHEDFEKETVQLALALFQSASENLELEELDSLGELMRDWAKEHKKSGNSIAAIQVKMASRFTSQEKPTGADYAAAEKLLEKAKSTKGATSAVKTQIQNFQNEAALSKLTRQAKSGDTSMEFAYGYMDLMPRLYESTAQACNGGLGSLEQVQTCSAARKQLTTASSLPKVGQAQAFTNYRNEIRMQRELAAAMGPMGSDPMLSGTSGGLDMYGLYGGAGRSF